MLQEVTKSYSFYCDDLNICKYDLLLAKAEELLNFRNYISTEVCTDFFKFANMSKFDWINNFRTRLPNCNNQDISNCIQDVYVAYENKLAKYKQLARNKTGGKLVVTRYKRNTRTNCKGDVKSREIKFQTTKFTKICDYLTKYYNDGLIDYIKSQMSVVDSNKKLFYADVLYYVDKFGDRLLNYIKLKRANIVSDITAHPIEFSSLSFTGTNQLKNQIINRNNNKNSIYGAVITIGAQKTDDGKLHIPVKWSRKHHGKIEDYWKAPNKAAQQILTSYKICLEKNQLRIILTKKTTEYIPTNKTNYLGVDVNVKHNLFATADEKLIDYDRNMFDDYIKFLKHLDNKQHNKKSSKLSNKDSVAKLKWLVRIKDMLRVKANELVNYCKQNGYDHIVLEDLEQFGRSFSKSDEFEGFKYSRLTRLLCLSDLKHIIKSIANKFGIQVTFIQPHYTSQTCECGFISRDNRKTQENFECICCGSASNADTHSANMIQQRLTIDVLRHKLLNFRSGQYSAKLLKKDTIKEILAECYDPQGTITVSIAI